MKIKFILLQNSITLSKSLYGRDWGDFLRKEEQKNCLLIMALNLCILHGKANVPPKLVYSRCKQLPISSWKLLSRLFDVAIISFLGFSVGGRHGLIPVPRPDQFAALVGRTGFAFKQHESCKINMKMKKFQLK